MGGMGTPSRLLVNKGADSISLESKFLWYRGPQPIQSRSWVNEFSLGSPRAREAKKYALFLSCFRHFVTHCVFPPELFFISELSHPLLPSVVILMDRGALNNLLPFQSVSCLGWNTRLSIIPSEGSTNWRKEKEMDSLIFRFNHVGSWPFSCGIRARRDLTPCVRRSYLIPFRVCRAFHFFSFIGIVVTLLILAPVWGNWMHRRMILSVFSLFLALDMLPMSPSPSGYRKNELIMKRVEPNPMPYGENSFAALLFSESLPWMSISGTLSFDKVINIGLKEAGYGRQAGVVAREQKIWDQLMSFSW